MWHELECRFLKSLADKLHAYGEIIQSVRNETPTGEYWSGKTVFWSGWVSGTSL